MPPIQYVKGDARYMKIQNPGSASGDWNTPQKIRLMSTSSVTSAPAVCALGSAATVMCANVLL